jgi:PHD/YefM family antitoxin component YafN of YafNO toxin-antitoxin module
MARAKRRFVVDDEGRKESVLLPVKEYEELLEDLQDLALMAERNEEPTESLEVVKRRLEKKWQSTGSR